MHMPRVTTVNIGRRHQQHIVIMAKTMKARQCPQQGENHRKEYEPATFHIDDYRPSHERCNERSKKFSKRLCVSLPCSPHGEPMVFYAYTLEVTVHRETTILAILGLSISAVCAMPVHSPESPLLRLGDLDQLPEVQAFKEKGFHSLWLTLDCEKVDPITLEDTPDATMKLAARNYLAARLKTAGIDVHFSYSANTTVPRLSVNARLDLTKKITKFDLRLIDYPDAEDKEEQPTIWQYSKEQATTNEADVQRVLGEILDEFLAKFKPYVRK
jgi:hypothetical protein